MWVCRYEQALKGRPEPFVIQLAQEDGTGKLRIGLNVARLLHTAHANLPNTWASGSVDFSWRVVEHAEHLGITDANQPFKLSSNRHDPAHKQPPSFQKYHLRPEQQRSLHWMLAQEASEETFEEEEVAEAVLVPLGWRAEAKASRKIVPKGGIVADQVGYGKTAITLGMIDASPDNTVEDEEFSRRLQKGQIATKATLILVPGQLLSQWPKEISK